MNALDRSHDPTRTSWVVSANGHAEFPIQNLPFGSVRIAERRGQLAVAIGDEALLMPGALAAGWGHDLPDPVRGALESKDCNALAYCTPEEWTAVRLALSDALSDPAWEERLRPALVSRDDLSCRLPFHIHDYTDFYASIHHATNVGSMFRPDNPLLPNYKWVPIGYHGRSSSLVVSSTGIRRPSGQTRAGDTGEPAFGPSKSLDYELEIGIFVGGTNAIGSPVAATDAPSRIFGYCLLNDWSARDVQAWEYQPLGPFLAKNFASTISPWVITSDAVLPFRVPMPARPAGDPEPMPHLRVPDNTTLQCHLSVTLRTAAMVAANSGAMQVSAVEFAEAMYWSPAQLVTHHASNGCNLQAGDMLGTGTVSGTTPDSRGCLLERTWRGKERLALPNGESRAFLEDGDEVTMHGTFHAKGATSIGFGPCRGRIIPA